MKRITTIFMFLMLVCMGAGAETVTWTSGGTFNESTTGNFSGGWFSVVSPFNGTLSTFTINLGTGGGNSIDRTDAYLAISKDLKSSTSGFTSSDFLAISTNTCGTSASKIDMTFSSDAVLFGGVKYYFYFVTRSGDNYTTVSQRYYHDTSVNNSVMSFGNIGSTSASYTGYAMPFSGTMTLKSGGYYRIKGVVPTSLNNCYLCSNSANENKLYKSTSAPAVTDSRFVWNATINEGVVLQNVGNNHYIPTFTSTKANGSGVNYLSATTSEDAVAFSLTDRVSGGAGYVTLKTQYNSSDTWLNNFTKDNNFVGCHNASPFVGDQFLFQQLKKVTFTSAVAVNGGSKVTTIYVAMDGSDSFTLPAGYLYSIGGATEVTNTTAASTIAAAGTTDLTVTVNEEIHDAAATITSGKLYRIFTYNNGSTTGSTKYYLTTGGRLTDEVASAGEFIFTATTESNYINAGYAWRISDDETNYFTNPKDGILGQNYIARSSQGRQSWDAQVFYLNENGKYAVRCTNASANSTWKSQAFWTVEADDDDSGLPDADYTMSATPYIWEIEEVASVTYNLIFQGETIKSVVKDRASVIGTAALPKSSWDNACCAYSYSPSTIDSETETVNITMTWNIGSLTFSKDYASATWYHMSVNDKWAKYDASVNGTTNGHPLCASLDDVNYDVAGYQGMWAFVGNPIDGVFLMNREAGDGQVLGWTTPPRMQSTNEGSSKRFVVTKYGDPATGFILSYSGYYINDLEGGSQLKFRNNAGGASDARSAITVQPISYYELSLMELDNYAATHAEGKYFGLKSSAVTVLRTQIETAKPSDAATYSAVHDAIEALWPGTDNANVYYPATGYYRIKSSGNRDAGETYITYGYLSNKSKYGLVTTPVANKYTDAGTIIKLASTATTGVYTMSLQGLNVQDVNEDNQPFTATASDGVTFAFELLSPGVVGIRHDTSNANAYLHESSWASPSGVVRWTATTVQSHWTVEDAATLSDGAYALTINMNDGGDDHTYATLYLPFGVTIDSESDVDAYIMTIVGEVASGTNIGKNIPANTGVILKGTNTSVNLTINDAATATTTNNDLEGTCVVKDARENVEGVYDLVLGKGTTSNTLGFYLAPAGGKLAANKAYLPYRPAAAGARVNGFAIQWDDETTGIRSIDNGKQSVKNGAIYDLSGRRVENPQRGLYIVNGRVVVVK